MSDLVNIGPADKGYKQFKMKDGSGTFMAKKSEGGGWYYIILSNGTRLRNLAVSIESIAEEVKS